MWYAVETAFVDGKVFGSRCLFVDGDETSPMGHCFVDDCEKPFNQCQKEFGGRIEIHTDWFESEELAHAFCDGKITYIHHYEAYYDKPIRTTRRRFLKREIVKIDKEQGIFPYRGIYKDHITEDYPWWLRY